MLADRRYVRLRGLRGVWPVCLVAGVSFAVVQFLVSNFHGPWLVDAAGALISVLAVLLLLRFWQPGETWRFPGETAAPPATPAE